MFYFKTTQITNSKLTKYLVSTQSNCLLLCKVILAIELGVNSVSVLVSEKLGKIQNRISLTFGSSFFSSMKMNTFWVLSETGESLILNSKNIAVNQIKLIIRIGLFEPELKELAFLPQYPWNNPICRSNRLLVSSRWREEAFCRSKSNLCIRLSLESFLDSHMVFDLLPLKIS